MASIRKRTWTSGGETRTAWIVDYFDQDRKRHIETFRSKKAADSYLTDTLHEVKQGTHTAPHSSITVREAAALWLQAADLNGLERSTKVQYRNNIEHHIIPLIGNVKLSDLSTPRVQAFADALLDRPYADDPKLKLSRSMARKVLGSLKSIIKHAQRLGKVAKNAAEPVSIKIPKRGTMKIRAGRDFPSKSEVNAMLAKVEGRWRPLIIVATFTGLRSSELRGLRWSDVDIDAKMLHVRQRADLWNQMGPPKSEAGERDIPLAPMAVNALREWKLACPKKLDLVFPNGQGKVESHANFANRCFYPLQVACGIVNERGRARYGFHTLRHFFASWLLDQGFSIKKAQVLLGHSTMAMTADTYGHLLPNIEDDQARFAAAEAALTAV